MVTSPITVAGPRATTSYNILVQVIFPDENPGPSQLTFQSATSFILFFFFKCPNAGIFASISET